MTELVPAPKANDITVAQPEQIQVLLVEDNPGDARLIEFMLSEAGNGLIVIQRVERLATAVEKIDQGGVQLVLSDLSLPDSQGLETFHQLHSRAPGVPIIVLSGLRDATVALQAVHEGAQDYLIKGQVDGESLVRSMRYALERQRLAGEVAKYAEELRMKNAQLEADLHMAREIQELFLPQAYPTVPPGVSPGQSALRFAQRYLPARAVGGDFFDVFPITANSVGVFICDVMGHGMRAALVTAIMRGLVEELIGSAGDPSQFVTGINRSLHAILRRTTDPFLATAFYMVVDVELGELRFTNAGHPSPLLIQASRGCASYINQCDPRHGPALGLFGQPSFPASHCPISHGDVVVLFTDGLFEATNVEEEEFGLDRLLKVAQGHCGGSVETLCDEILRHVHSFHGSKELDDDVCVLGVEVSVRPK